MFLKQSTSKTFTVLMVAASDHISGLTGVAGSIVTYLTQAGGTPALITPIITELDATNVKGLYAVTLTSTHTNTLGDLQLHFTATGADPTDVVHQVIAINLEDINALGLVNLDATVSSRLATSGYTAPDNADVISILADVVTAVPAIKVKTDQLTFTIANEVDVNVKTVNGTAQTAKDLGASATQSGDNFARLGVNGAGLTALGDTRLANLDTTISSRLATTGYTVPPTTAAIATAVAAPSAATIAAAVAAPTSAVIANSVWNTLTSNITTTGSIGLQLKNNVDTNVGSRMATFAYTAPDNASILTIKASTNNLPSDPADESLIIAAVASINSNISSIPAAPTVAAIATGLLDATNGVETGFTLRQALRLMLSALAGKVSGGGGTTVTIRDINDTTNRIVATVDTNGDRTAITLNDA